MKKSMNLGNFNVTFGENFDPMLSCFFEIIYPAMTNIEFKNTTNAGGQKTEFFFHDVKLKVIDNEHCLVGNFVKSTKYNVFSQFDGNKLIGSDLSVPSAPYSRFIIFLKNHRMVLIKNETNSPSLKNFRRTLDSVLKTYVKRRNKDLQSNKKLPMPNVNIISISLDDSIEATLSNLKKINSFTLCFYPLNNDINPIEIINDVNKVIKSTGANSANLKFNSPCSKESIINIISKSNGMFAPKIEGKDYNNSSIRITSESFSSSKDIDFDRNILPVDDEKVAILAKEEKKMQYCSYDNKILYNSLMDKLDELICELA